jgi:hypothetical protein
MLYEGRLNLLYCTKHTASAFRATRR